MGLRELRPGIYEVGVIDWHRKVFDELIPLPEGTSYNSYLIKGSEKTALIDTVDPAKSEELIANLSKFDVEVLDYVVANHAEQDHSGSLPRLLKAYPKVKVVTNPKCRSMLQDLLLLPDEKFIEVQDREKLSLGDKTLEFIYAPWVHWPETMLTYCPEELTLFTCDYLGSHLATSRLLVSEEANLYQAAKRYYAEIMMPFRTTIRKNMEKIKDLKIEIVAPSHGPVHANPRFIIDAYDDWTSDQVKNEVIIPYISMHGSTEKMVNFFIENLMDRNIPVKPFNLSDVDTGELAMAIVDAATIIVGTPTVLAGAHPNVLYALHLVNALRPKTRFASIIGSYGWGGKMVEQIKGILPNLKAEFLSPVVIKGFPREENYGELKKLADLILTKHQETGLL